MNTALAWQDGSGFLDPGPGPESVYDDAYWQRYVERADTEMGRALVATRVELVDSFCQGEPVCDVGIGCGAFIGARGAQTYGFDINPVAVEWLRERAAWLDPRQEVVRSLTFWDSLEHITEPSSMLGNVSGYAFVSTPIYRDQEHCLASKHYKPGEHVHYWTHDGLVRFMEFYGFRLVEHDTRETDLGREDIGSYVFERHRRPYLMGRWAGLVQWRCPWCAYDTLESEERILSHVRDGHARKGVRLIEGSS